MIDRDAPILPGKGLGGIQLGSVFHVDGWNCRLEELPWELSWIDKNGDLRLWVSDDLTVIASVDTDGLIQGLYATPKYQGCLLNDLRAGMLGKDILDRHPAWKFRDFDASIVAPDIPGFFLKHQEFDLWNANVAEERFDFIAVFQPDSPYFS